MNRQMVTIDGNEAAAYVAYNTNEVIAIYLNLRYVVPLHPQNATSQIPFDNRRENSPLLHSTTPQLPDWLLHPTAH